VQPPVWVVHVSDTHAGQSSTVAAALSMVLEQVVAVVGPAAVLHSGDLVDEGGEDGQWAAYRAAVDGRAAYPTYMEIPGNHDMKSDGRSKYLAQSVTGRAGGGLYGDTVLETPGGRLRVVRTNTADSDTNVLNLAGVFSQEQLDALLALPPRHARYTVVLGHHPVVGLQRMASPGSTGRMEQLLSSTWADLYLCGHTHTPSLDWAGSTLSVRADSLGHTDPPAWVLLGLDDNGPSAREVAGTPWPLVLVTSPADGSLAGGNPRARPVANPVRVRALAFSPTGVAVVEARVDSGPWQALVAAGTALWAGEVAASPGAHAVTVRASDGQGTDTHRVVVTVAQ
jgi:predicted MPP superfamily phosphohydrolase